MRKPLKAAVLELDVRDILTIQGVTSEQPEIVTTVWCQASQSEWPLESYCSADWLDSSQLILQLETLHTFLDDTRTCVSRLCTASIVEPLTVCA